MCALTAPYAQNNMGSEAPSVAPCETGRLTRLTADASSRNCNERRAHSSSVTAARRHPVFTAGAAGKTPDLYCKQGA